MLRGKISAGDDVQVGLSSGDRTTKSLWVFIEQEIGPWPGSRPPAGFLHGWRRRDVEVACSAICGSKRRMFDDHEINLVAWCSAAASAAEDEM
jgi:hypothetical protein